MMSLRKFSFIVSQASISFLCFSFSFAYAAEESVIPDNTLGNNQQSEVSVFRADNALNLRVDGGSVRRENLFHSFRKFSPKNKRVFFIEPTNIENIFVRVTGSSISDIQSVLGVRDSSGSTQGKANLFLMNPNGIFFGPNSRLDLGGSFLATTANRFQFESNGTISEFSSINPQGVPLLALNIPIGLQFGDVEGVIRTDNAFLQVQHRETLALVGSNLSIENNSVLLAEAGKLELGSIASNEFVAFETPQNSLGLDYKDVQNFRDIHIFESIVASLSPSTISGDIQISGKNIIVDRSSILTSNENFSGGSLSISASNSLEIRNFSALQTLAETAGDSGDILIEANHLTLSNESQIDASTFGSGSGGVLSIIAPGSVEILNNSDILAVTAGEGSADSLLLKTGRLTLLNGGRLSVESPGLGTGQAGNLDLVVSDSIVLSGNDTEITASSASPNNAGGLFITTGELQVTDGASINVSSTGGGNSGILEINAQLTSLENRGELSAETTTGGGNILLNSNFIFLLDNSLISTDASDAASGGDISISSDILFAQNNSDITTNATFGAGGNITISSQGIFGLTERTFDDFVGLPLDPRLLDTNDVTAFSQDGGPNLEGNILFQTPETDPSEGLLDLPIGVLDASKLITKGCFPGSTASASNLGSLTVTGRGGVAINPAEDINSETVLTNWVDHTLRVPSFIGRGSHSRDFSSAQTSLLIVEAQGWQKNSDGKLMLTAESHSPSTAIASIPVPCQRS